VGGYKSYRQAAHESFAEPKRVIILAGTSGAGKTQLLGTLKEHGQQVIDLERLANHRGSAFGGIGQPAQPSVEQFENNLFEEWRQLNPDRPVWIECESQAIGRVKVPKPVWGQMAGAPAVFLDISVEARLDFLVSEYGQLPKDELIDAIQRIEKRLGGADLKSAIGAIEHGDIRRFAEIALRFYDKSYNKALAKRPFDPMETVQCERAGHVESIQEMNDLAERLTSQTQTAVQANS
jgi:tRNA 2-selenouridine synthase